MVRFSQQHSRNGSRSHGGSRFNDMASYATDTSSITNPHDFGLSYSDEDDDDNDAVSFMDSATSALTGLTGWTSVNGGGGATGAGSVSRGMGDISELGESQNFPMAHSKSYKSSERGAQSVVSEMASERISAISFELGGSVETSIDEIEVPRVSSYKSKSRKHPSSNGGGYRPSLAPIPSPRATKAVQFAGANGGGDGPPPVSLSHSSSILSNTSNNSKKRAPVPPLRDPGMEDNEEDQMWEEDCNYDINPTLMFLVLESHDWKESIALLDGKGLENKNDAWNLGSLFGGKSRSKGTAAGELTKKRQRELRAQARTWIVRRERNGVLRWRMLPLHAALAFNAPFDVVLRLYHLYPGAVRCRNDQGMLPLHHVFKYGNEDKILELLLDVFPEALTVVDDKRRLPLACTPNDGSDNERRSNILTLFGNFQVEMATKNEAEAVAAASSAESQTSTPSKNSIATQPKSVPSIQPPRGPLSPIMTGRAEEEEESGGVGTLGAAPRYTTNTDYTPVTFNSIKPTSSNKKTPSPQQAPGPKETPLSPRGEDDANIDRYAFINGEDSENVPLNGRMGLSPIPEEGGGMMSPKERSALKSELLVLGEKKKRRGLKKLFGKKTVQQI